ncbi:MAG: HlyD family efflux transporter periplasmic adaptor subunit [Pseudomonadota bacterium]
MAHLRGGLKTALGALAFGLLGGCGAEGGGVTDPLEHSLTLAPQPFTQTMQFSGRIAPGEQTAVSAPFDGAVTALLFTYGDRVEAGDALLELDPTGVARARAEAEAAFLRADAEARRLEGWGNGPEMSRARRALTQAESELADIERRLEETRALLEQGLVPRTEYDSLLQQRRSRQMSFEQTREELAGTRARGTGENLRIAHLEREVAQSRFERLDAAATQTVVRAPTSGLAVRPPEEAEGTLRITVGAEVRAGQAFAVIARTEALNIVFSLNEADVNALHRGMAVTVTGAGFPETLHGRIASIAGQAEPGGRDGQARFTAAARLDPLPETADGQVRIGMTAQVTVVLYEAPAALLVPPQAIFTGPDGPMVRVRAHERAPEERRAIHLGARGPQSVEVINGLSPGEIIVWEESPG